MRRVLVPLDGFPEAEAVFPDAKRLAGPEGELILVREATLPLYERDILADFTPFAVEEAEWYLRHEAERLRDDGVQVRTQSFVLTDPVSAIDQAVAIFRADLIALATHGRQPLGRLFHGGVAWRALAQSPVPVLLRHVEAGKAPAEDEAAKRCIMVPLDGSAYAEKAIPLAVELALEWNAPLWLVRVVSAPDFPLSLGALDRSPMMPAEVESEFEEAQQYLARIAAALPGEVHTRVEFGAIVDHLVAFAQEFSITDVVMASHGTTGLTRVILGSVADAMIHRLHLPIIIIPALAAGRLDEKVPEVSEPMGTAP